jgi:hypothetical protein
MSIIKLAHEGGCYEVIYQGAIVITRRRKCKLLAVTATDDYAT